MADTVLLEHIFDSLAAVSSKLDAHATASQQRVDELRNHIDRRIEDLRNRKDADNNEIHRRIDEVQTLANGTNEKVSGIKGWAAGVVAAGGVFGAFIGWCVSFFSGR